jgi:hypothetical protein
MLCKCSRSKAMISGPVKSSTRISITGRPELSRVGRFLHAACNFFV